MITEKRLDWVDISKGIGIILVVFAHTIVPQIRENSTLAGFLWIFIYNFHMPLFFFLSGLLFERGLSHYCNKGKFILGKLKFLMLPYITFSVFAYLFITLALKIAPLAGVLKGGGYGSVSFYEAILQVLPYNGHMDQHLWFVYSLFLVFLVNILFPKIMKSKTMTVLLLLLYISKAYIHYYGILDYTASDLFFFSLARVILSAKKDNPPTRSLQKFFVTAAVFIITNCIYSYFYVTHMPSGAVKTALYLVRSISSVTGIFTVCVAARYIQNRRSAKLLKETGVYSYDIYLMHAPFLVSGSMGILLKYTQLPAPICCAGTLIIGIALPYLVSRFIIRKIPVLSVPILGKSYGKSKKSEVSVKTEAF